MNLSRLKVGSKILLGFGVVVFLLAVVASVSSYYLLQASSGLARYRETARNTNTTGRVQANLFHGGDHS